MPKCDRYRELCSLSLDTELSDDDAVMLFKHLAECPACAEYLEDLHQMQGVWNDLKEPLPEDLHEKIMQSVTEHAEMKLNAKNKGKRPFPVFTAVAAAAACVMLALSGSFAGILGKTSGSEEKTGVATGQTALERINPDDEQGVAKARIAPEPNDEQTQQQQTAIPNTEQSDMQSIQPSDKQPQTTQPSNDDNQSQSTDKQTGDQNAVIQNRASAPQVFSATEGESKIKTNAAESQSVKIPDELQTSSFAFCCVAAGGNEVPTINDAKFIEKNGNTYYFKVTGVISDFDKSLDALQKNGFETAMRTDLGLKIDASASEGMLILVLSE